MILYDKYPSEYLDGYWFPNKDIFFSVDPFILPKSVIEYPPAIDIMDIAVEGANAPSTDQSIWQKIVNILKWIKEKIIAFINSVIKYFTKLKEFFFPNKIHKQLEVIKKKIHYPVYNKASTESIDYNQSIQKHIDTANEYIFETKFETYDFKMMAVLIHHFSNYIEFCLSIKDSYSFINNLEQYVSNNSDQEYIEEFRGLMLNTQIYEFKVSKTINEILLDSGFKLKKLTIDNLKEIYDYYYSHFDSFTNKLLQIRKDYDTMLAKFSLLFAKWKHMNKISSTKNEWVDICTHMSSNLYKIYGSIIQQYLNVGNNTMKKIAIAIDEVYHELKDRFLILDIVRYPSFERYVRSIKSIATVQNYPIFKAKDILRIANSIDPITGPIVSASLKNAIDDNRIQASAFSLIDSSIRCIVVNQVAESLPEDEFAALCYHEVGHIVHGHKTFVPKHLFSTFEKPIDPEKRLVKIWSALQHRNLKHEIQADFYAYRKVGKQAVLKLLKRLASQFKSEIDMTQKMIDKIRSNTKTGTRNAIYTKKHELAHRIDRISRLPDEYTKDIDLPVDAIWDMTIMRFDSLELMVRFSKYNIVRTMAELGKTDEDEDFVYDKASQIEDLAKRPIYSLQTPEEQEKYIKEYLQYCEKVRRAKHILWKRYTDAYGSWP